MYGLASCETALSPYGAEDTVAPILGFSPTTSPAVLIPLKGLTLNRGGQALVKGTLEMLGIDLMAQDTSCLPPGVKACCPTNTLRKTARTTELAFR